MWVWSSVRRSRGEVRWRSVGLLCFHSSSSQTGSELVFHPFYHPALLCIHICFKCDVVTMATSPAPPPVKTVRLSACLCAPLLCLHLYMLSEEHWRVLFFFLFFLYFFKNTWSFTCWRDFDLFETHPVQLSCCRDGWRLNLNYVATRIGSVRASAGSNKEESLAAVWEEM